MNIFEVISLHKVFFRSDLDSENFYKLKIKFMTNVSIYFETNYKQIENQYSFELIKN